MRMVVIVRSGMAPDVTPGWVSVKRIISHVGRRHPLLLLSSVAKPDPDNFLFQLQAVRQIWDLLSRRLRVLVEVILERALDRDLDACPLLPFPALGRDFVYRRRSARRRVGLSQPLLEQRHQLAHVFETQLEGLEPADGRLREDVAVERAQREPDVGLREAELDPPLLELLGERFEVVWKANVYSNVSCWTKGFAALAKTNIYMTSIFEQKVAQILENVTQKFV